MKLTKKLEAEIKDVYEAFWGGLLNVDIEIYGAMLDTEYRLIGTTEDEVFFNKKEAIKFLKDTAVQVAGNIERRNSKIKIESINGLILITEQFDAYVLIEDKWTFYAKTRVSTLMQKKSQGWKLVQQHFSFPDAKAAKGETIGLEKISKENLELRDAIKRRTIELEHKNRELEIEAALERTRTQSMLMQNSDEILNVSSVFHEQLVLLGIPTEFSYVWLPDEAKQEHQFWATWAEEENGTSFSKSKAVTYPLDKTEPYTAKCFAAWQSNEPIYVEHIPPSEVKNYFSTWEELLRDAQQMKAEFFPEGLYYAEAYIKYGCFGINIRRLLSEDEQQILRRFTVEFERTYTRFLDLQKAETQAREAEIELALERLRARTMAMHQSYELAEAASVMFEQLSLLGASLWICGFHICKKETEITEGWVCPPDGKMMPPMYIPYTIDPFSTSAYQTWRNQGEMYTDIVEGMELQKGHEELLSQPAMEIARNYLIENGIAMPTWVQRFAVPYTFGYLMIVTTKLFEETNILLRFAKVFDQTYTRFLDLQKAEAQARESQIQLALERVRARTMAMQHSDELKDAAALLFQQVKSLGVPAYSCGYNIWEKDDKEFTSWMSTQDGSDFNAVSNIPLTEDANFIRFADSRQKGEQFFVLELRDERMQEHYQYLKTIPAFKAYFDYAVSVGFDLPETQIHHLANFSQGNLLFITLEPCPEFHDVFKRFAAVFDQTYTRFLDLQKAEAQAREAKIEAALEKVRSRSLAMHKSDEIEGVLHTLFERLKELDIDFYTAIIILFEKGSKDVVWWLKSKANHPFRRALVPYTDIEYLRNLFEARQNGTELISNCYPFEEKNKLFRHLFDHTDLKNTPEEQKEFLLETEFATISVALAQNTGIHITSYSRKSFSEQDNKIFKRFAKVFEQAYTRFLDLQKAEAQAREAQIEAALEKVRSRSLAMHKSDELREVVAVVFEKLVDLGFALDDGAVGILIFSPGSRDHVQWIVDPSNSYTSSFDVAYTDHALSRDLFSARESDKDFFAKIYPVEEKNEYFNYLFEYNESYKQVPVEIKNLILGSQEYGISVAFEKNAAIVIPTNSGKLVIGDNIEILKRFVRVFEQAYTRFLDLQKAEAQAREAQIEASLERVRSRSMAMHKSDELSEVVSVLYKQFEELDFGFYQVLVSIYDKTNNIIEWWSRGFSDMELPQRNIIPIIDHPFCNDLLEKWENGVEYYPHILGGEMKKNWDEYIFTKTDLKNFPQEVKDSMQSLDKVYLSDVFMKYGSLQSAGPAPLPDDKAGILKRFVKVLDQAYTRMIDLQKAEAQAREAQIQLALERVRARTMAMQHSHELNEVVHELYLQIRSLDFKYGACTIVIMNKNSGDMEHWLAGFEQEKYPERYPVKNIRHPLHDAQISAWKKGEKFATFEVGRDEIEAYADLMFTQTGYKNLPEEEKKRLRSQDFVVFNMAYMSFGALMWAPARLTNEQSNILQRFAKVFDQTHTRFLDIQKAEAQAKEAQIEASLERVRSRTMGMQKSEELKEVIQVVYDQFVHLNIHIEHTGFIMDYKARDDMNIWLADQHEVPFRVTIPYFDCAHWNSFNEAKAKGINFFANHLSFEEKNRFYQDLFKLIPGVPEETLEYYFSCPGLAISTVLLDNVGLYIENFSGIPFSNDENATLMRFGKVFQQTYTRFLDLQKAEAQAREATIEAALERVRGKAMAMHSSGNLAETIGVFYRELRSLSATPRRCGVALMDKESGLAEITTMNTTEEGDSIEIMGKVKVAGHPVLDGILAHWVAQKEYHPVLRGAEVKEYYDVMRPQVAFPDYPTDSIQFGYYYMFDEGWVYAWTEKELPEDELKIYRRFTSVLSLTYKRYKDLKDAEARAQIAVKDAALDRIRADIASMRTTNDLERITPLIWNELIILGVPFIRCGVFIMDEAQQLIHTFLSTPDGKAIGAFHLPYTTPGNISQVINHWRDNQNYIAHWDESAFTDLAGILLKQGAIPSMEQYLSTIPHGGFHLHFLPFLQGMLYVGNTTRLGEDEIRLIQSVADAFSTAYARYEDFNKLEAAKQQVDKTLVDLKQAQTQLVQSEKMASLGELTAGIAHEIQNPLNFVNNFSDVSNELLEEMKGELTTGNIQQAIEIAENVKQNLEKILHHGKRADAIVKGMLQHSRTSSSQKEPTDINVLADEYLRLAYHGLRAKDKSFNAKFETDFDINIGKLNIIPQEIGRVILNLINNAFYAVSEKKKELNGKYEPTVSITTKTVGDNIEVRIKDNGIGIPQKVLDKIFQPFFTTKPTGQGTGLGLSLAYDIVKAHGGELKVETKDREGTEFTIQLPLYHI